MNFNVPGSSSAQDEFRFPGGGWCSVHRSISFNSSLRWQDVLPASAAMRSQLTAQHVANIGHLARLLHRAERTVTSGKLPLESPFQVLRWWDPSLKDWHHGRRCCLRVQGLSLPAFLAALPENQIRSIARAGDTFEAIIPDRSTRRRRFLEASRLGDH